MSGDSNAGETFVGGDLAKFVAVASGRLLSTVAPDVIFHDVSVCFRLDALAFRARVTLVTSERAQKDRLRRDVDRQQNKA